VKESKVLLNIVTGCAGFIGSTLADALLACGERVTGIDCFRDYYDPAIKRDNLGVALPDRNFRLLELDLADDPLPDIEDLTGGEPFVIYHLAAQAGVRHSWGEHFETYIRDNVAATQKLLEWCRGADNLRSLVFASSSSVYGSTRELPMNEDTSVPRPYSPYGVTKLAAEHLVNLYHTNYGIPAVSCRFFTVYGPRQRPDMAFHRFIMAGLKGEPILIYGSGEQTRDFTYAGDIVQGLLKAKEHAEGQVFNLGGGNRVTLNHALETLQEVMGVDLEQTRVKAECGDVKDTLASTEKAERELDWHPGTTLEEGLRAEFCWLKGTM
jgi:nucleoside-diphosphate-sugar epimerase